MGSRDLIAKTNARPGLAQRRFQGRASLWQIECGARPNSGERPRAVGPELPCELAPKCADHAGQTSCQKKQAGGLGNRSQRSIQWLNIGCG